MDTIAAATPNRIPTQSARHTESHCQQQHTRQHRELSRYIQRYKYNSISTSSSIRRVMHRLCYLFDRLQSWQTKQRRLAKTQRQLKGCHDLVVGLVSATTASAAHTPP